MNGQEAEANETATPAEPATTARSRKPIVLAIIVAFLVLLLAKIIFDGNVPAGTTGSGGQATDSITSVRNDAVADFDAAVASGKPIYVLFHSLS